MKKLNVLLLYSVLAMLLALFVAPVQAQLSDVTQPGDPLVPSSNNSPGSEGGANAIDNQPTKYLNFDRLNTGFTVTPRVGLTVVQMLTLTSANDAPERDPADFTLEGSYDGSNFVAIASGPVPTFTNRYHKVVIAFSNNIPYNAYRLIFPNVVGPAGNSMQISEVEFLGFQAPGDVTQPGDPLIPSSNNSPGSEGVANAIDNQPTKYLNFDRLNTGFTVTPSVGATLVKGITLTSANDAPERDPADYTLEGSLDGVTFFPISSGTVPAFLTRYYKAYIFFDNFRAYRAYRLMFPNVVGPAGNSMQISEVELLGVVSDLPQDVTQPGDPLVPSSNNSPGSEGVANAIDNQPTKYLNFDRLNTGFTVSPRAGLTLVSGLTLTSANDAPERDPVDYTLEGSWDGSNFVAVSSGPVPAFTNRYHKVTVLFDNRIPYNHYRLIFPNVVGGTCCMQISEVELLGVLAPSDVTVPGDPLIASSNNSPGSEGVANAIDNQPTKYLNFDRLNTGFTVTPGVGDTILSGITLTSANDAPERDPADYTLEGSVDGVNYFAISSGPVPTFLTRYYKNYIFFPQNTVAYKSYRLMFPNVVGPAGNSMQISEVEFLGVTPVVVNTNEVTTLVRRQPQDTPVLLGSPATFRVELTGPWRVQWYRNGTAIPGANNATYTTANTVAGDDGALFHAVVSSSQGQQTTDTAVLSIFTPSTIESVGVSFEGEGASGAPTAMFPTDITGFHPQAYWNNLTVGTGTGQALVNSSNEASAITLTWTTSGEWGVGTGEDDPTQRMLNGMGTSFGTTEAAAQTITFNNVPPGSHSVLVYLVQIPLEFFNMDFIAVTHDDVGADVVQRRYIRPQNADEYNPSPGFVLVTSTTAATRSVGNFIRFDNLQPGPDGFVQLKFYSPGRVQPPGEPIRGPGVNGFQLLLNPGPVPNPPVISQDPVGENAPVGGTVVLRVQATGDSLTYQWLKNGQAIDGETGPTLTLENLQEGDAAKYTVAISNPAGRVVSRVAPVDVLQTDLVTEDLVVYFKFDEPGFDLGVADNWVTGGVDGEVRGTSFDAAFAQVGGGIALNGIDNYVFVPDYVKPTNAMTVMGWISANVEQTPGTIINNWVGTQPIGSRGQFLVDLLVNGGIPQIRGQIGVAANVPTTVADVTIVQFEFNHFALSANGSSLNLYWNGQLVESADYIGNININNFPWLAIGATFNGDTNNPAGGSFWGGVFDEFAVWKRSLSGAEINAIYTAGLAQQSIDQVPSIGDPFLTIFRQGNDVVVSWSQNALGYTLQSSPSLAAPNWTTVAGVVNNRYTATAPTGMRFFRLIK